MLPDNVKISIEKTRTKYYVWEDEKWVLASTEYFVLVFSIDIFTLSGNITYMLADKITNIKAPIMYFFIL
jgi:hypothetical protein